jgi:CRP-like cAMP-binding protein
MQPDGCLSNPGGAGTLRSMPAFDVLRRYLSARAVFTADDFAFIETVFFPRRLLAEEFLQRAGEVACYAAFVAAGCLRSYVVDSTGNEHVVQLAPESSWMADSASLAAKTPTLCFIQAIEDSELLLIDPMSHDMLVRKIPAYGESFQPRLQNEAEPDEPTDVPISSTLNERYLQFLKSRAAR